MDEIYLDRRYKGRISTERVLKAITNELTDKNHWSIKGDLLGDCWHKDCCMIEEWKKTSCGVEKMTGEEKISELLHDTETQRLIRVMA